MHALEAEVPECACSVAADESFECFLVGALPRSHVSAVAPGRTPADAVRLEQHHGVAALAQVQRRRKPRVATTDHAYVGARVPAQGGMRGAAVRRRVIPGFNMGDGHGCCPLQRPACMVAQADASFRGGAARPIAALAGGLRYSRRSVGNGHESVDTELAEAAPDFRGRVPGAGPDGQCPGQVHSRPPVHLSRRIRAFPRASSYRPLPASTATSTGISSSRRTRTWCWTRCERPCA
jgi:hypothetical protein